MTKLTRFDPFNSKGRRDASSSNQGIFFNDIQKLNGSKSLRRLQSKTQVWSSPRNTHIRTRRSHTDEVEALSEVIAHYLDLNNELCRAIAIGHDIGHAPFGHEGERLLSELSGKNFKHNIFSVVVAQHIENTGRGLNLSYETLEGIIYHSSGRNPIRTDPVLPNEYLACKFADKIAYVLSDHIDAKTYGLIDENLQIPVEDIGKTHQQRIDSCVSALVEESRKKGYVSFSEGETFEIFSELRDYMYNNIYPNLDFDVQKLTLKKAYEFFEKHYPKADPVICVALMTDKEAIDFGRKLYECIPIQPSDVRHFGVIELMPYIENRTIDFTDPGLDWGKNRH